MPRAPSRSAAGVRVRGRLGGAASREPVRVARAEGLHLVDEAGKRYLDLTSGWCVGNLGWGRQELREAIARFDGPDYVFPHLEYAGWGKLAAELCDVAPGRMRVAFRATGGSEAVDLALQAAMLATGRRKFLTLEGSYHGNTLATLAIAGGAPKGVLLGARHLKPPFDEKALRRVEAALRKGDVAAVVMEPISMTLGVEIPEREFMHGLEQLCKERDVLLVADEVACGFGRTGRMFASERYGLEPDIVCMGKAITNGAAPMGAVCMTKRLADDVEEEMTAYSTYGWHPLSVAVARANLATWRKHGRALLREANARGDELQARLEEMTFQGGPEVRVKGLAAAVHLGDEAYAWRIGERCRKKGVLVSPSDCVLQIFPPLTIDARTLDAAMDTLASCV